MKTVTISFSEQQLQILSSALENMQYRVVAPLIEHIGKEIQKQMLQSSAQQDHSDKEM